MESGSLSARQRLLLLIVDAEVFGDRRRADAMLVEATRWLDENPDDAVIFEAREHLRARFPP